MSASTSSPHQPTTCQTHQLSANLKNLAVFIDGTSNKPGEMNTNVFKLFTQVNISSRNEGSELEQRRFYLKGIGASKDDKLSFLDHLEGFSNLVEMAFACNVNENVKAAYLLLVENYQDGDRIYLFGFSRGAYQVRSLASMIHEVGLVRDKHRIDDAYRRYHSIDLYNDESRMNTIAFKQHFCWKGVRIHFIGVWDTVSSLGLVKKDVHITSSASVTNACHFRHALALDEHRVKFMPEYFTEVNAHRGGIRSPRLDISDVKEVWFAGGHSDVGGMNRRQRREWALWSEDGSILDPIHAGNVSLMWMKQEAAACDLRFEEESFRLWDPEDVDLGREDTMTFGWKILEVLPIRHQISFCGTGEHERRLHLARPRSVIPSQQIHPSVLSTDLYTPCAVLGDGVGIPTVPRRASGRLWTADVQDEKAMIRLSISLLTNQQKTPDSLSLVKLLFQVLNSELDSSQTRIIPIPQGAATAGLRQFTLVVLYDMISEFSVSEELVKNARDSFSAILSSGDKTYSPGVFYILRFITSHQILRQRFIAHDEVISALMVALEYTTKTVDDNPFQLVLDSLCCLINDDSVDLRNKIANKLCAKLDGTKKTRISAVLDVKAPSCLTASLRMITCLVQHRADVRGDLERKITALAKIKQDSVGPAAVEALVALEGQFTSAIPFANTLGYLCNILPRLDSEVGSTSPSDNTGELHMPRVLQNGTSGVLDKVFMSKLLSAVESRSVRERTVATLTLLKLCRNSTIRRFCSQDKVVQIFLRQLERKEASLLAVYALKTYIRQNMVQPTHLDCVSQSIVNMLTKGWFDGAIGQVEGFQVFRELMDSDDLKQRIISDDNIIDVLIKKLQAGKRREVRMSLICLDIFGNSISTKIKSYVQTSVSNLKSRGEKNQRKAVKILSALAQTKAGEEAIHPYLMNIVQMLLPPSGLPRSQLFGPTAALYGLSKNETLRRAIQNSKDFMDVKREHGFH